MNPTKEDLKNVSEWFSTSIENVNIKETKSEPIEYFLKDILECLDSHDEFPDDARRTNIIMKDIMRTGEVYPVYVEFGDSNKFVMEGRHRMIAFHLLGYQEIPVCYVENLSRKENKFKL